MRREMRWWRLWRSCRARFYLRASTKNEQQQEPIQWSFPLQGQDDESLGGADGLKAKAKAKARAKARARATATATATATANAGVLPLTGSG